MLVYHGTRAEHAQKILREGMDGTLIHPRVIHGLQDFEPGLFVTPTFIVARRFGLYIIEIQVELSDLTVPPMLRQHGVSLEKAMSNPLEPQAFLARQIDADRVRLVECHPNNYPFNPYDDQIPLVLGTCPPWAVIVD